MFLIIRQTSVKIIRVFSKAIIGFILMFIYHISRLICLLMQISCTYAFNNPRNLTAGPVEHVKRAKKLLRRGFNAGLLYAALELKFVSERMVQWELIMANMASNRMIEEHDAVKKVS